MKRLICGCEIAEKNDRLVKDGVLAVGDKLEDCDDCREPDSATYYSTVEECWVRLTEDGVAQGFINRMWRDFSNGRPRGLIKRL